MKQAIANHRSLDKIIREMREITQKLILEAPETTRISAEGSPQGETPGPTRINGSASVA